MNVDTQTRRVRDEVRDGLGVMLFSMLASAGFALGVRLLIGLGK